MAKTVAFQGERGAYSERAALAFYGSDAELVGEPSFRALFAAITEGKCEAGVVPIENSLAGSVHENYDLLLRHKLPIVGEIILRISHHLMVLPGVRKEDVRRVISHPQALRQCQDYLDRWESVTVESAYDTAGSGKRLVEEGLDDYAAIASEETAEKYGLEILERAIESNHENFTRFLFLEKQPHTPVKGGKTSIVFSFEDKPGALFKSLAVFALRDINLLKIESRPLHGSPFNYYFYLDIDGSVTEEPVRHAIDHLQEIATFLQILGSYPKGRTI